MTMMKTVDKMRDICPYLQWRESVHDENSALGFYGETCLLYANKTDKGFIMFKFMVLTDPSLIDFSSAPKGAKRVVDRMGNWLTLDEYEQAMAWVIARLCAGLKSEEIEKKKARIKEEAVFCETITDFNMNI